MSGPAVRATGAARAAAEATVAILVADKVASSIAAGDATLWGPEAEHEASIRLGWTQADTVSAPLVPEIVALREELNAAGVDRIVLCGMGGSSLAPEVITQTADVPLVVLDSTHPDQIAAAVDTELERTAVVVSSKSGSTVETDSQRRLFEERFRAAGIDPAGRIVVVTDPGSPLEASAREAGYRVFTADPHVGGRYSALTAFGLVPSGLAGVDIAQLLADASAARPLLESDSEDNPALTLAAALAATQPRRDKFALLADTTTIVGLPDWAEQLIAESTGKEGTGILPVVLDVLAPELLDRPADLQLARIVADASHEPDDADEDAVFVSGPLGAQFLLWEYAVAIAGRLLGINPFDQPDVESAKAAARGLLDAPPAPEPPLFSENGIAVSAHGLDLSGVSTVAGALDALFGALGPDGYVAVQAYLDRLERVDLAVLRDLVAARCDRPTTFGWGPRFLHSTGQYHKGGAPVGVFLQIVDTPAADIAIPGRPFTFGELIRAQYGGDAQVLAEHGRPVLTLQIDDSDSAAQALLAAIG